MDLLFGLLALACLIAFPLIVWLRRAPPRPDPDRLFGEACLLCNVRDRYRCTGEDAQKVLRWFHEWERNAQRSPWHVTEGGSILLDKDMEVLVDRCALAIGLSPAPQANPSIKEEYERSDAVIVGKAVGEQSASPLEGKTYFLTVEELLRGTAPRTTAIFSYFGGFSIVVGKRYLLFIARIEQGRATFAAKGNSGALPEAAETLAAVRRLSTNRLANQD